MNLKKYRCEEFVLRLTTDKDSFLDAKFFGDPRVAHFASEWKKGSPLQLLHFTKNPGVSDYHTHTRLWVLRERVRLVLDWVARAYRKSKDAQYPFAEDVTEWIDKFFVRKLYFVRVTAFYSFPSSLYTSQLGLPMPFLGPGGRTRPRRVVGMSVSVDLKDALRTFVDTHIIDDKEIVLAIVASYKGRITRLGPEDLLPRFESLAKSFVSER